MNSIEGQDIHFSDSGKAYRAPDLDERFAPPGRHVFAYKGPAPNSIAFVKKNGITHEEVNQALELIKHEQGLRQLQAGELLPDAAITTIKARLTATELHAAIDAVNKTGK